MRQHTLLRPRSSRRRPSGRRRHRSDLKPVRQAIRVVDANGRSDITVGTSGSAVRGRTGADVLGCSGPKISAAEALVL